MAAKYYLAKVLLFSLISLIYGTKERDKENSKRCAVVIIFATKTF
jgi:hypothetical protein